MKIIASAALAVLALAQMNTPAHACSVVADRVKTPQQIVSEADLILRVRVTALLSPEHLRDPESAAYLRWIAGLVQPPPDPEEVAWLRKEHPGALPESYGAVQVEVLEVLTGTTATVGKRRVVVGQIAEYEGRNTGRVPYEQARPGASGACFALDYAIGHQYLLLIRNHSLRWAALAPLNEEVSGPNDPWVKWVKAELKRLPPNRPKSKSKPLSLEERLEAARRKVKRYLEEEERANEIRAKQNLKGPFE